MIAVPVYGEHCKRMCFLGLEILSCLALGTLVDVTFFCTYQKHMFYLWVKVETETTSISRKHTLILFFSLYFVKLRLDASYSIKFLLIVHLIFLFAFCDLQSHNLFAL